MGKRSSGVFIPLRILPCFFLFFWLYQVRYFPWHSQRGSPGYEQVRNAASSLGIPEEGHYNFPEALSKLVTFEGKM